MNYSLGDTGTYVETIDGVDVIYLATLAVCCSSFDFSFSSDSIKLE